MKREYHLSKRLALNIAYEIAMQYKESLSEINDYEIWAINLRSYSSNTEIYVRYEYTVLIQYYDTYKRKYIRQTLEMKVEEKQTDGAFITEMKVYKDW